MKLFTLLNENKIDLPKLEKEVEIFRNNLEKHYEWVDDKACFKGTCQDVSEELVEYLNKLGYQANRMRGYYKNADDDYSPNMENWDLDDQTKYFTRLERNGDSANGLPFPHWWVEVDKYIIDITEDQFHPDEEDVYRVGIYRRPNENYRRG